MLLDRWPRRRVIVVSQLIRAAAMLGVAGLVTGAETGPAFFGLVLLVFSVNRFILAGLSSAMPHVVPRDALVSANSVAPTCGSLAYLLGGAVGTGVRPSAAATSSTCSWPPSASSRPRGSRRRLPFIGPTTRAGPLGRADHQVGRDGLVEAVRTLPRRAWLLLGLVFVTRIPFGFLLLQTLLLFRGPFEAGHGARGFGIAAGASALGFASAAFVTPWLAPRLTAVPYAARMLALGALVCAVLGPFLTPWSIVAVGFAVSFTSQCVKITVDSLIQAHVDDHLLGRAFSAYDVVYNAGMVAAAALGAFVLPESGLAWWPLVAFAVPLRRDGAAARPALVAGHASSTTTGH